MSKNIDFKLEYKYRIRKKENNFLIKKKIENIIKTNFKSSLKEYKNLLDLQKKINKNKISKIFHPIRVSYYSTFFFKNDIKLILLSIIHNVLEYDLQINLSKYLKKENIERLKKLHIEKNKKYDKKFLPYYYKKIYTSDKLIKKLKCLDKLDNLFNLYKNNDVNLKKKYLFEIKKYILPLSKSISQPLYSYLKLLYLHNKKLLNER